MGLIPKVVTALQVLSEQTPHDSAVGQQQRASYLRLNSSQINSGVANRGRPLLLAK